MTRIRFTRSAMSEVEEAAQYYAAISPQISVEFRDEIDKALSFLQEFPAAAAPIDPAHRRHKLRRFPYVVIYRIEDAGLVVVAVAHAARKPGYWRGRSEA